MMNLLHMYSNTTLLMETAMSGMLSTWLFIHHDQGKLNYGSEYGGIVSFPSHPSPPPKKKKKKDEYKLN